MSTMVNSKRLAHAVLALTSPEMQDMIKVLRAAGLINPAVSRAQFADALAAWATDITSEV